MKLRTTRQRLLATTVIGSALFALASTPSFAQTAPTQEEEAASVSDIVVTGSIIRRRNANSVSPLTILGAEDLENRGVTTTEEAIQTLSGNNAGALPNAFTAGGAFAGGASGASLRGLLVSSTLVLIDGMRGPFYPIADDGARNFVDLNSIPSATIDRIEVLQDGASSTYGADAIAGVINIITKKNFQGLTVRGEYGISGEGDAEAPNFSATWGRGDLGSDGYNFYVSGEYQKDESLLNRDRGFPYNTSDLSGFSGTDANGNTVYGTNNIVNGIQRDGHFAGITTNQLSALVRPYDATNTTAQGQWQPISASCPTFSTPHTLTAAELVVLASQSLDGVPNVAAGTTLCQTDTVAQYGVITPEDERYSLTARLTKTLGANAEAYVMASYYHNEVSYTGLPANYRNNAPPVLGVSRFVGTSIALPVLLTDGSLNPNNPFAAQGQVARLLGSAYDIPQSNNIESEQYRVAAGITGEFGDGWNYNVAFTAAKTDLTNTAKGYIYIQHLLDVVADGSYNFVDPTQNSQAVRDYVSPTNVQESDSELVQIEANISKDFFELPGGPLAVGLGASYRYEAVDNPSANPFTDGPTEGYFTINPFFSKGDRNVSAAYFEVNAPLLDNLEVNLSGRYDDYSTGQSNFSPKVGVRYRPFQQLMFRATYAEGFRIPSIAEGNSQTTGYVTYSAPQEFQELHGNNGYGRAYSLGITTGGNQDLKPETSDSINLGFVFTPTSYLTFSVDHFQIRKDDVIAGGDFTPALDAYYNGTALPEGYEVVAGAPDPNFPDAQPIAAFVISPYQNLNSLKTRGFDFSATGVFDLTDSITWTSSATATFIESYEQNFPQPDGSVDNQEYAGSIGPYVITAASGTPQWRGSWQNTLDFGRASLTATTYYTGGYALQGEDVGDTIGDCARSALTPYFDDGATIMQCDVDEFINVDLHASYDLTDRYQIFADVQNVFDEGAPLDLVGYGGYNYNPSWATSGIIGRYFKVGFKATF